MTADKAGFSDLPFSEPESGHQLVLGLLLNLLVLRRHDEVVHLDEDEQDQFVVLVVLDVDAGVQ